MKVTTIFAESLDNSWLISQSNKFSFLSSFLSDMLDLNSFSFLKQFLLFIKSFLNILQNFTLNNMCSCVGVRNT